MKGANEMDTKRHKPIVGEVLYSLNVGNSARRCEQALRAVTVSKVGRKYFYVDNGSWYKEQFYIDTWEEKTEYAATVKLYETEREWLDEKEAREICTLINNSFVYSRPTRDATLDQLRRIKNIIEEV